MSGDSLLGKGWGFPPEFRANGKSIEMVEDEVDIKQSLEILFTTAVEERLNLPDFGCDLKKFAFEEINNSLALEIQEMILNAIDKYEKRVQPLKIEVTESEDTARILLIEIDYLIKETDSTQNMTYAYDLY